MFGRLFGKKKKKDDKNYDPKSKYREGLFKSPVTTYSDPEMKNAQDKIVKRLPTQPEFDEGKMRDAGPHMEIVGSYDPELGKPPRARRKKNRSRRKKTPTNRRYLDIRPKDFDYRYHPKGKRRSLTEDMREDLDPFELMGGKTRKRRRKRRRKTKRKGKRKTKKKRKMKKRKTRRKR